MPENVKGYLDMLSTGTPGGDVFAAVHNIQANVPIENIIAMWETFLDSRK